MRSWTPTLYEARPSILVGLGAVLTLGAMAWSLVQEYWTTAWRGLALLAGAAPAIVVGALLQLRQDDRARSKRRRETSR